MHSTRLTAILASGATAVLLTLTAGCGSTATGSKSDSKAGSSAGSSKGSGSSASSASGASLTKSDIFTKLTDAQKKAGSYTFTMTIDAGGKTGTGKGEADASSTPPAVHVSLNEAGQSIETITAGGLFYFKAAFLGTDKWIKIDPKDKSGLGALVGQNSNSDPTAQLAAIADAAKVVKGGSTTIEGTKTTEYDVTVPGDVLAKKSKLSGSAAAAFPKEIVYKLFVDGDNLLRRMTSDIAISGHSTTIQIDFADYGKPVTVQAPPASEINKNFKFPGAS